MADEARAYLARRGLDPAACEQFGIGYAPDQRQGLFKHVHPHMLRHSFASHILESSGDLRGVQELLGHADIATTEIYTHVDSTRLVALVNARHPLANGAMDARAERVAGRRRGAYSTRSEP